MYTRPQIGFNREPLSAVIRLEGASVCALEGGCGVGVVCLRGQPGSRVHGCAPWRAVFEQCGYKFCTWYDMVWMERIIGQHVTDQPAVRPFLEVANTVGALKPEA